MKVLITTPKKGTAIDRMAQGVAKYNPHHEFRIIDVHPKRPDERQLQSFLEAYDWCDVWDAEYWKTAEKLREIYGDRIADKPTILAHMNPYDLLAKQWNDYTVNIVANSYQQKILKSAGTLAEHIPLAVDLNHFTWNEDYTERKTVLMVAQRIESSKGIEPVARACAELGYIFILVGEISDAEYFESLAKYNITFMERISDHDLRIAYSNAAILVCNSKDNFESGTLPILEAMASGVVVLTRNVGHVPDLYNEKNMVVRDGQPDDFDELKALLKDLMQDRERRLIMREEAWHTVRNYSMERRARLYSQIYYRLGFRNDLVSVIMPVFGRHESLNKMVKSFDDQSYPAIELVVVSDGDASFDDVVIQSKHTVKYMRVGEYNKYGLALARNMGAVEAEGKILVFFDQRFIPHSNLIEEFVKNLTPKKWLYANKNNKRNFVENVSCIYRQEFIDMGMCNQLMDGYGGMSQELRERSKRQGFKHSFIENAIATPEYSSHNYNSKKDDIRRMKDLLWKLNLY